MKNVNYSIIREINEIFLKNEGQRISIEKNVQRILFEKKDL